MPVTAIAINCSLKKTSGDASSTDTMIAVLKDKFSKHDVAVSETLRIADYNVLPGVTSDEGAGDDWPELREKILAHDILIFGGPIWMPSYGKVAVAAIVGNEDGAHWSSAQLFQSLNDTGWTIPAVAACYWVGEAMNATDFKDLDKTPDTVDRTATMVATNAAHLAKLLAGSSYPGIE